MKKQLVVLAQFQAGPDAVELLRDGALEPGIKLMHQDIEVDLVDGATPADDLVELIVDDGLDLCQSIADIAPELRFTANTFLESLEKIGEAGLDPNELHSLLRLLIAFENDLESLTGTSFGLTKTVATDIESKRFELQGLVEEAMNQPIILDTMEISVGLNIKTLRGVAPELMEDLVIAINDLAAEFTARGTEQQVQLLQDSRCNLQSEDAEELYLEVSKDGVPLYRVLAPNPDPGDAGIVLSSDDGEWRPPNERYRIRC
jgi:hypothetical protein